MLGYELDDEQDNARDGKLEEAKKALQEWVDKQGHERCWYYPEIFNRLCEILDVKPTTLPCLPVRHEFESGCIRYQREQYGSGGGYAH